VLQTYKGLQPRLAATARVHESAVLIGDVFLDEDVSVWPCAVLRAELAPIRVGRRTSIQDGCVLHIDRDGPVVIGEDCVVGHLACVHACTVGSRCLVGIHATILTGAVVGDECVIGAGALVGEGRVIPPRSLVLGVPGRIIRQVTDEEVQRILGGVREYLELMKGLPPLPTDDV
jgi:carbonic anhydrase/acetyltransferase-like protein (isoleucine patch superfamily)